MQGVLHQTMPVCVSLREPHLKLGAFDFFVLKIHSLPAYTRPGHLNLNFQD